MAHHRAPRPFVAAAGVSLFAGRWLEPYEFDGTNSSVLINETPARQLFGTRDPLGERIDPN